MRDSAFVQYSLKKDRIFLRQCQEYTPVACAPSAFELRCAVSHSRHLTMPEQRSKTPLDAQVSNLCSVGGDAVVTSGRRDPCFMFHDTPIYGASGVTRQALGIPLAHID